MKKIKILPFLAASVLLLSGSFVSAQTADEIISKYLQAIGGKELIGNIKSLYVEGSMDVMGSTGPVKMTTLNGKGYKLEIEVMGSLITTCFNEKQGWSINPLMGTVSAEAMPEAQYNAGKGQLYIGAPFVSYAENGYKAELLGNESVGDVNAFKIKLTAPESSSFIICFFDPATGYMVRTVQQSEIQGQMSDNTITFSDYRQTDGFSQPFKMTMNMGGQFESTVNIKKVEINKPVDEAIFVKP